MIDRAKQIRKLQNNDRLTIAEIKTDMFGEGGKEEVEEYYTNDMNETKMKQTKENPKVVANVLWRYEIWSDGIVYDTEKAEDIPEYIFEIRDLIMKEKE
jgi:hypothetical protein